MGPARTGGPPGALLLLLDSSLKFPPFLKQKGCFRLERDNPFYNARIKFYPNGTQKITVFNKGVFNPDGWERFQPGKEGEKRKDKQEYDLTNPRSDNVKRSRDQIFDLAIMNEWTHFVTLTLDGEKIDRYDVDQVRKKVKKWLEHAVSRKNLRYILIPEYHKDGAIHFHGLFAGDLTYLDSGKKDKQGRTLLNIKEWRLGFSSAVRLDGNPIAISRYITKYITKSNDKIFGSWALRGGHGLVREVPSDYAHVDFDLADGVAYEIPQAGLKVKYIVVGEI